MIDNPKEYRIGCTMVDYYKFTASSLMLIIMLMLFLPVLSTAQQTEMAPEETEVWNPVPEVITPGEGTDPPSDARILLGKNGLANWRHTDGNNARWKLENGVLTVVPGTGSIETRQEFGSVQLHLEWRAPSPARGEGQDRGNSGVYLHGRYEVQVLDSYNNRTYSNGMAGSIYKQSIPMVNAARPPGEWQTYDIIFIAPEFNADGSLISPARLTVFWNGVLVQYDVELQGPTIYRGKPNYEAYDEVGPLLLQDHDHPVSYRNIWLRELPERVRQ